MKISVQSVFKILPYDHQQFLDFLRDSYHVEAIPKWISYAWVDAFLLEILGPDDWQYQYYTRVLKLEINRQNLARTFDIESLTHREFEVVQQWNTASLVKDMVTGKEFTYKLLDLKEGDCVFLYVKKVISPEKIMFAYSCLNNYIQGEKVILEVLSEEEHGFVVGNQLLLTFFLPNEFRTYVVDDKIELIVKAVDLMKNRLIFESADGKLHDVKQSSVSLDSIFKKNERYLFDVVSWNEYSDSEKILHVSYQGIQTTVKLIDFTIDFEVPSQIYCIVKEVDATHVFLHVDRYALLSAAYSVGKTSVFRVLRQEVDTNSDTRLFILSDRYGFIHKLYESEIEKERFKALDLGDIVNLFVNKIHNNGYLVLSFDRIFGYGDFITAEQVFEAIDCEDLLDRYFYKLEEELTNHRFKQADFIGLYKDYERQQNLWIFSYLKFLNVLVTDKIFLGEYLEASTINFIFIRLEEWILEGSDFLLRFGPEKREAIIYKAETKFSLAKKRRDALELLMSQQTGPFIAQLYETLGKVKFVRGEKVDIFKLIFLSHETSLTNPIGPYLDVLWQLIQFKLLSSYDLTFFYTILERKMEAVREWTRPEYPNEKPCLDPAVEEVLLWNTVQALGIQLTLSTNTIEEEQLVYKSAKFSYYLRLLSKDPLIQSKLFELAVALLAKRQKLELTVQDFKTFDVHVLAHKMLSQCVEENQSSIKPQVVLKSNGALAVAGGNLLFLSSAQARYLQSNDFSHYIEFSSLLSGKIQVVALESTVQVSDQLLDMEYLQERWMTYYRIFIDDRELEELTPNHLKEGDICTIYCKNYFKQKDHLIFGEVLGLEDKPSGILTVREVSKVSVNGLAGLVNPGDEVKVKVYQNSQGKLSFSLIDLVWQAIKTEARVGKEVVVKLVHVHEYSESYYFMTEEGHYGNIFKPPFQLKANSFYLAEIVELQEEFQWLKLKILDVSQQEFDIKVIYRDFLIRNELLKPRKEEQVYSDEKYWFQAIKQLIWILERVFEEEPSMVRRFELLQILKLAASILKSGKSFYYQEIIRCYGVLEAFKSLDDPRDQPSIDLVEGMSVSRFPALENINQVYAILNTLSMDAQEGAVAISGHPLIDRLSELVYAYRLLSKHQAPDSVLDSLKSMVHAVLDADTLIWSTHEGLKR
jgi:hypothetical protein